MDNQTGEFCTVKVMRHRCPLSPIPIKVVFVDLEMKISRCHFFLSLLLNSIERFGRYVKKKGVKVNVENSKVMRLR